MAGCEVRGAGRGQSQGWLTVMRETSRTMAHTRVLGKNRSQVPPPYGHWSYVEWVFSFVGIVPKRANSACFGLTLGKILPATP